MKKAVWYYFLWLTHNCIAHPLMGLFPFGPFFKFHDLTSPPDFLEDVDWNTVIFSSNSEDERI